MKKPCFKIGQIVHRKLVSKEISSVTIKSYADWDSDENCWLVYDLNSVSYLENSFEEYREFKNSLPDTWCCKNNFQIVELLQELFANTRFVEELTDEWNAFSADRRYPYMSVCYGNFDINNKAYMQSVAEEIDVERLKKLIHLCLEEEFDNNTSTNTQQVSHITISTGVTSFNSFAAISAKKSK